MSSHINVWDYVVVGATLILSSAFGLYNGCLKKKQSTFFEYFLGSRNIPIFPIAMSSFATIAASGMMIGFPSEVYYYGLGVSLIMIIWFLLIPIINYFVIPVIRQLQSGNIFEFYEIRYNRRFKKVITFFFVLMSVVYTSATVYGPSTAVSLVTGINLWIIVIVMVGLCLVYTVLGGMRAVVFADTIQGLQMLIAFSTLLIVGTIKSDGISEAWVTNVKGKRLEVDFSLDATITHTVWSSMIGWSFSYGCFFATNQANMQRLLACASTKQAQRSNTISVCTAAICQFLLAYLSLLAYAEFANCDPLRSGKVTNMNQILPFYVMETFQQYSGLPGLYFAGLLSATLSTLSSAINSLAAITVETFLSKTNENMSERKRTNICKFLGLLYGIATVLGVFLTEIFPNVMHACVNAFSGIACPLFALFVIGIGFPQSNCKGCIIAFIIGVLTGLWLITGVVVFSTSVEITKPLSTEGCATDLSLNSTLAVAFSNSTHFYRSLTEAPNTLILEQYSNYSIIEQSNNSSELFSLMKSVFPLANISYLWLGFILFWQTVFLCLLFTYFMGKEEIDKRFLNYIPPVVRTIHNMYNPKLRKYFLCDYQLPPLESSGEHKLPVQSAPLLKDVDRNPMQMIDLLDSRHTTI